VIAVTTDVTDVTQGLRKTAGGPAAGGTSGPGEALTGVSWGMTVAKT
jgi:hypothetical protein